MTDRLIHTLINLACACLSALFGGYILASIIAFATTALLNFFRFNFTISSIVNSFFLFCYFDFICIIFLCLGIFYWRCRAKQIQYPLQKHFSVA